MQQLVTARTSLLSWHGNAYLVLPKAFDESDGSGPVRD